VGTHRCDGGRGTTTGGQNGVAPTMSYACQPASSAYGSRWYARRTIDFAVAVDVVAVAYVLRASGIVNIERYRKQAIV
jgi:hypothetical protein